jgi:hypothetical protein
MQLADPREFEQLRESGAARALRWSARIMRTLLFSLLAASAVLASSVARADDGAPSTDPPRPAPTTRWYGYQTLSTDGVALGFGALALTAGSHDKYLVVTSLGLYGLGAPIIHFAHGHVGKGFGDLGMRVGMMALGAVIGGGIAYAAYTPPAGCTASGGVSPSASGSVGDFGLGEALGCASLYPALATAFGVVLGGIVGGMGASAIDAVLLARENVPSDRGDDATPAHPHPESEARATITSMRPTFGVAPERTGGTRATLGLVGTF